MWSQFQWCIACSMYSVLLFLRLPVSRLQYRNINVEDWNSGACCAPSPSLMYGVCCDAHVLLLHVYMRKCNCSMFPVHWYMYIHKTKIDGLKQASTVFQFLLSMIVCIHIQKAFTENHIHIKYTEVVNPQHVHVYNACVHWKCIFYYKWCPIAWTGSEILGNMKTKEKAPYRLA